MLSSLILSSDNFMNEFLLGPYYRSFHIHLCLMTLNIEGISDNGSMIMNVIESKTPSLEETLQIG